MKKTMKFKKALRLRPSREALDDHPNKTLTPGAKKPQISLMSAPEASNPPTLTPMMKQWWDLKAQAKGALLFFRLGDFYELFEEDAETAAPILQVVLTSRGSRGTQSNSSPLCGVPVAHIDLYLNRALDHGFKIALAEQVEDPQAAKALVRREIVQWFTPGIRLLRTEDRPHYAAFVTGSQEAWSLAAADVGTGHVVVESGSGLENLQDLIDRLPIEDLRSPRPEDFKCEVKFSESARLSHFEEAETQCLKSFNLSSLEDLPSHSRPETQALGSLFAILDAAHPRDPLRFVRPRSLPSHVWMNAATRRNLYLFDPPERSLFHFLDKTQTAIGRRELKLLISNPIRDAQTLKTRQELVAYFKKNSQIRKIFRTKLHQINDLHRLLRKRRGPSELFQISQSLHLGRLASLALDPRHPWIEEFQDKTSRLEVLIEELHRSLQISEDEEWGWIQKGISPVLDDLRTLKQNSQKLLADLEENLRQETKVSSLKIKFHQVFGYVIEVTQIHKDKVPERAKRIQTLANAERFKTPELEALEEKILSLDARLREAERAEISRLYELIEAQELLLLDWSENLGRLDCFQSLAEVSESSKWVTPRTLETEYSHMRVLEGVHPLTHRAFVPLNFDLHNELTQMMLLTGPNMSGKSTLLRLAALIALLHQIGSDVPAREASLSLFDRIVCRMGAQDDMTTGQSTFYVEMREVASMLHGAHSKSLLIFDEIGRGTSTFDGMSLAWAITEEVHELKSLCLMATHYLELAELEKTLPRLKTFHLGVEEVDGKLLFTRSLQPGPASRSYGIQVARLAEVSDRILSRAESKLKEFERRRAKAVPLFELQGYSA